MPPKKFIDRKLLKKHVEYDPETGQFKNKIATPRMRVGHVFSTKYPGNYVQIYVDKQNYAAHRAAWVYMTGKQPDEIDHLNGIKHDNRWSNLANVTHSQNMLNTRRHRPPDTEEPC